MDREPALSDRVAASLAVIFLAVGACSGPPTTGDRALQPTVTSIAVATSTAAVAGPSSCEDLARASRPAGAPAFPKVGSAGADEQRAVGRAALARGSFLAAAVAFDAAQVGRPTDLASATLARAAELTFDESQGEAATRLSAIEPVVVADRSLVASTQAPARLELSRTAAPKEPPVPPFRFLHRRAVMGGEDHPGKLRDALLAGHHRAERYRTLGYGDRWLVVEDDRSARVFDVAAVVPRNDTVSWAARHGGLIIVEASRGGGSEEDAFGGLLFAIREETGELVWKSRDRVSNRGHFETVGRFAIVTYGEGERGTVSAIDMDTGATAFAAPVDSGIEGLRVVDAGVVVDTRKGSFLVQLPGVDARPAPAGTFGVATGAQRSMPTVGCAIDALAAALDARDATAAREVVAWLDALVAPRGVLRAARAAASQVERAEAATAWDLQARAPLVTDPTAPQQSPPPPKGCTALDVALVWTQGADEEETTRVISRFGVKQASAMLDLFSFQVPVPHPAAPPRLGGEELRIVRQRGEVETFIYGDRYVFVAAPTTLVGSFDVARVDELVLDALLAGDVLLVSSAERALGRGSLRAYDASTGALRWRRAVDARSLQEVDGRVLAISRDAAASRTELLQLCGADGRVLGRSNHGHDADDLHVLGRRVLVRRGGSAKELELSERP